MSYFVQQKEEIKRSSYCKINEDYNNNFYSRKKQWRTVFFRNIFSVHPLRTALVEILKNVLAHWCFVGAFKFHQNF